LTSNKSATPGRRKRKPLDLLPKFLPLFLLALLIGQSCPAKELRRSMSFIRPWLMGDAYVAVGDEASTLFHNPAGLAGLAAASAEVFNPQLNVDDRVKDAILDPDSLAGEFEGVSEQEFRDRLGETVFFNLNFRLPSIVRPSENSAYGLGLEFLGFLEILENPVLPGLRFEFFFDKVFFYSLAFQPAENFKIGLTAKLIERIGIDKVFTFGELFAAGATLDFENDPALSDAKDGVAFREPGLDVGFLYYFPFWPGWQPRMGLSLLNIGGEDSEHLFRGMEFGPRPVPFNPPQAGELPQLNTIGVAVSPTYAGIRYTIALDIVDFTQTVLPGDDREARTRLGFEAGIGPREDGTALFSLLLGFNATHTSLGILSRVWIFEVGFGTYSVELGEEAGDKKDSRFLFLFGIRI
jgi:hypothetical protein